MDLKRPGLLLSLLAAMLVTAPGRLPAKGKNSVSGLRKTAYEKSGEWLYEGLQQVSFPDLRPLDPDHRPIHLPVDWARQAAGNKEKFPLFEPSALDYRNGPATVTACLAGFRTGFYSTGPRLFDDYFKGLKSSRYSTDEEKKVLFDHEALMRDRSMVFYLSFPGDQVQLVYYPGKLRFKGGDRHHVTKWLPKTPSTFKKGTRTDFGMIQDSQGLLSIFNATFDTEDNFAHWIEGGKMRCGGFGYDHLVPMEPHPEMATIALYDDGRLALGTYQNLPHPEKIRTFIQNRFTVIEKGKLAKDSNPDSFCSFYDDIARSYLFIDKQGRVGYLWSLYTPANVVARMALSMGVKDMVLLDIHSPISCAVSDPGGPQRCADYKDYMRNSHDWVPNFFRLSPLKATLTWISRALDSRIQNHYIQEAFQGGNEAFFAVFLKGSPEAMRVEGVKSPEDPGRE